MNINELPEGEYRLTVANGGWTLQKMAQRVPYESYWCGVPVSKLTPQERAEMMDFLRSRK